MSRQNFIIQALIVLVLVATGCDSEDANQSTEITQPNSESTAGERASDSPAEVTGAAGSPTGGTSAKALPDATFESPESVFKAYYAANENGDYMAALACATPKSQVYVVAMMANSAWMLNGIAADAKLDDILKRHGLDKSVFPNPLDPKEEFRAKRVWIEQTKTLKNKEAFFADVMGHLKAKQPMIFNKPANGEQLVGLEELSINGDSAKATIQTSRKGYPIEFERVDGRWLVVDPISRTAEFDPTQPPKG